MIKISHTQLNYRVFQLIAIFTFFDGIRSNIIGGNILTLFREGAIFYLLGYAIFKQKCSFKRIIPTSILWYLFYHTIVSFISYSFQTNLTLSFIIKPYEFPIAIYLFSHFQKLTHQTYDKYILFLIHTGIFFVILNTVLYFIYIPIWTSYQPWWGRISCGYPTMDVITLAYTLLILFYYPQIGLKPLTQIIAIIIILIGCILQFTGTGIVILGIILPMTLLYYFFFSKKSKLRKVILITFGVLIFITSSITSFIKIQFPKEYEQGEFLILNKIAILTGDANSDEVNTLDIRKEQFKKIQERQNSLFEKIFGIGLGDATNDGEKLASIKSSFMIEDQYSLVQVCYGYLGLILYILIPCNFAFDVLKAKRPINMKLLYWGTIIIFLANSKTLIPFVLFPNYIYFALFISLFKQRACMQNSSPNIMPSNVNI